MDKLILKLVANGAIVVLLLMLFTEATFIGALATAVLLTVIGWFLGDQLIYRNANNVVATVADGILAIAVLWGVAAASAWDLSFGEVFVIAAALAVFEFFFHRMLPKDRGYRKGEPVA